MPLRILILSAGFLQLSLLLGICKFDTRRTHYAFGMENSSICYGFKCQKQNASFLYIPVVPPVPWKASDQLYTVTLPSRSSEVTRLLTRLQIEK